MPGRALRRLLDVREIQKRSAEARLQELLFEQRQLNEGINTSIARLRSGYERLICASVNGDAAERVVGAEESSSAARDRAVLMRELRVNAVAIERMQGDLLGARLLERQARALFEDAIAREAAHFNRSAQSELDDHHRNRWKAGQSRKDGRTTAS